jgi:hypothetical protein
MLDPQEDCSEHEASASVAVASPSGYVFPGEFMVAGADPGPGGHVVYAATAGHVTSGFRDEGLGGGPVDRGKGLQ